jgi:CRP/FNR family transcriptional regulator
MLDHEDIIFLQEHLPFFKKLDEANRSAVIKATLKSTYKKKRTILNKEKECNGLVLVKSGQLRAFFESEDGKVMTLYRLLPHDICILTASCVLKNITFDVILEAEKDSVLYFIPAVFWGNLTEKNIFVKEFSMELVSKRFSELVWVVDQMVSKNMRQRIATFLLEQTVLNASDTVTITHETIANNLGTSREVISRILEYYKNDDIIRLSRGQIQIVDMEKLKEMSQ